MNPYQQYQNNSVLTATPQELTLMLYNGAIKFCNQAVVAMEAKDIEKAHRYILRAQDIVVELQASLDEKYAIAKEMDTLYEFIKDQLIEANVQKDSQYIEIAIEFLKEFRDTWKEAMKLAK